MKTEYIVGIVTIIVVIVILIVLYLVYNNDDTQFDASTETQTSSTGSSTNSSNNSSTESSTGLTKITISNDRVLFKNGVFCLDSADGKKDTEGIRIVRNKCEGKERQYWNIGDGYICNKWGKCFTATDNGRVVQNSKKDGLKQKWDIYSDGTIRMGDNCLTLKEGKAILDTFVDNDVNQVFNLVYI